MKGHEATEFSEEDGELADTRRQQRKTAFLGTLGPWACGDYAHSAPPVLITGSLGSGYALFL